MAFRVVADDYVTSDSGTGIVHCAPAFGEDDYRVCIENQIITKVSKYCYTFRLNIATLLGLIFFLLNITCVCHIVLLFFLFVLL